MIPIVKKILVPVDGSDHSLKAIAFAAVLAKQNDALVHLLHVAKRAEVPKAILDYMRMEGINESPEATYSEFVEQSIRFH